MNSVEKKYTIFTVCNLAYFPKALVLAESVFKFNNFNLKIFICDKKITTDFSAIQADIYWIEDMSVPNLYQLAFKYDIVEFSTSVKPYLTLKLLETFDKVIFLDPDTCLFHSVDPILKDLDAHSIVLTPHYTTPQTDTVNESDLGMMRFGSFNLGFYAVKNSEQGLYFLNWWSKRCFQFCFMESQFGLSTDQKWVTIAPCFFEDLYVSFNLGYNFAPWNSWERKVTSKLDGIYMLNDTYPLIFFHFSNFDENDISYLKKRSQYELGVKRLDLLELGTAYNQALATKKSELSLTKYAFDYMSGGEYISPTLRYAYACILPELPLNHNPFDSNGVVGDFAKKNFLLERKGKRYIREGFADIGKHSFKITLIHTIMRLILRIMGPNKFQNLSRLLVYLSSYRQNRGLWKYSPENS